MVTNEVLLYGLEVISYIQQLRTPGLDIVAAAVTLLGQEEFYLLALPLLLWCVDFRVGIRLSVVVLLSHYLNVAVKDVVAEPRPFVFRPEVKLFPADGYSFPSNHAQSGLVFWLSLAHLVRKRWLWGGGSLLIVLIGVSRLYLGVHFPTDVLAGWGIGLLILAGFISAQAPLTDLVSSLKPWQQGLAAILLPALLFALHPTKDSAAVMAALSGAGLGLVVAQKYFLSADCIPRGEWRKLAGRVVVGLIGLLLIWAGLKLIFPHEQEKTFLVFRYLRYWLAGGWLTFGAPWLFSLLGLVPGIAGTFSGKNSLDKTKIIR